jgi:hypothetical protein
MEAICSEKHRFELELYSTKSQKTSIIIYPLFGYDRLGGRNFRVCCLVLGVLLNRRDLFTTWCYLRPLGMANSQLHRAPSLQTKLNDKSFCDSLDAVYIQYNLPY